MIDSSGHDQHHSFCQVLRTLSRCLASQRSSAISQEDSPISHPLQAGKTPRHAYPSWYAVPVCQSRQRRATPDAACGARLRAGETVIRSVIANPIRPARAHVRVSPFERSVECVLMTVRIYHSLVFCGDRRSQNLSRGRGAVRCGRGVRGVWLWADASVTAVVWRKDF